MALNLARRLGFLVLTLAVASVVIFAVCAWIPGDPATTLLGTQATPAAVHQLRHQLGTDRPLTAQYGSWIKSLFTGDLGTSYVTKLQVWPQIQPRLGVTFSLVLVGMVLALLIAVPVGIFAAVRHRQASGVVVSGLSQIGLALPAFWIGILLAFVFSVKLDILPPGGYVSFRQDPVEWLRHLVLPGISLALAQGAVLSRYVRGAVLDVMNEDYIRTARAGGATFAKALWRHGLRNAAIPVVTVLGLQLATLLIGAIVIESVFTMPGLGLMLLQAVGNRDLVLVEGTVMILVAAVLILNFLVDLLYLLIDPRLRSSR
jgi:peptide/nickel transport system permease protein